MTTKNMYAIATRNKLRFPFRGMISVEDLWDLQPKDLDTIYKTLNSQKKQASEESLLSTSSVEDDELKLKIDIIKDIVSIKLEEATARALAKEKREQKQKIMSILASKQDEALQNKSIEELEKMLENIDDDDKG